MYRVAKTYQNYKLVGEPFVENGRMYSIAECKCDRCIDGTFVSRIENGFPVPHPAYGGMCLKCNGTGFLKKKIRLYTESEYEAMNKRNEKAHEKKLDALRASAESKKTKFLERQNFNSDGKTYIYFKKDSYDIKDQLKEAGFRFDSVLLWHSADSSNKFIDSCVEVDANDIFTFNEFGNYFPKEDASFRIKNLLASARPEEEHNSEWIGEEDEKINIEAMLKSIRVIETRYGLTQLVTFLEGENILQWWTKVDINFEEGEKIRLSGRIKKLDEYKGDKITTLTRCKLSNL